MDTWRSLCPAKGKILIAVSAPRKKGKQAFFVLLKEAGGVFEDSFDCSWLCLFRR